MTTYLTSQNQTLETNQLTSQNQNVLNLNVPQVNKPNIQPNINTSPQYNQNYNPQNNNQFSPVFQPQINQTVAPVINNNPTIIVPENKPPVIEIKTKRTIFGPIKLGLEPQSLKCPFCEETITTQIEKSTNIKALLTAIGTLFIGFVLIQICKNKPVGCKDCEHTCPNCGHIIGKYYAM